MYERVTDEERQQLIEFFNKNCVMAPDLLEDHMYTIAAVYDYAAEQVGKAYAEMLDYKRLRDFRHGILEKHFRSENSKLTVSALESLIVTDPQYQECIQDYNEAEAYRVTLEGKLRALQMKKDMLQILGSRRKRELDAI